MHRRRLLTILGSAFIAAPLVPTIAAAVEKPAAREIDRAAFRDVIGDRDVVFFALDGETGAAFALDPARAGERHPPFSSFKIPNLMIALETGVAPDLDHRRKWDPARRPAASFWPQDWRQDQTLASAFTRSAAWYFQDLARDIGTERYRRYLSRFGYGNVNVPEGSDSFWLGGSDPAGNILISPREQAMFMLAAVEGRLGLRKSTLDALAEVAALKSKDGVTLYGKTGSGPVRAGDFDGAFEGWLAGWVVRPARKPLAYALYARGPSYTSILRFRREMSEALLKRIGALPADW